MPDSTLDATKMADPSSEPRADEPVHTLYGQTEMLATDLLSISGCMSHFDWMEKSEKSSCNSQLRVLKLSVGNSEIHETSDWAPASHTWVQASFDNGIAAHELHFPPEMSAKLLNLIPRIVLTQLLTQEWTFGVPIHGGHFCAPLATGRANTTKIWSLAADTIMPVESMLASAVVLSQEDLVAQFDRWLREKKGPDVLAEEQDYASFVTEDVCGRQNGHKAGDKSTPLPRMIFCADEWKMLSESLYQELAALPLQLHIRAFKGVKNQYLVEELGKQLSHSHILLCIDLLKDSS
ncbi:hypothetical protein DFJ77DRAFT_52169 [Powellomyces hirtus]|nr:hypothetical protein DFJ77DRAFT_52169 [Powellomyces hirtus]